MAEPEEAEEVEVVQVSREEEIIHPHHLAVLRCSTPRQRRRQLLRQLQEHLQVLAVACAIAISGQNTCLMLCTSMITVMAAGKA